MNNKLEHKPDMHDTLFKILIEAVVLGAMTGIVFIIFSIGYWFIKQAN